MEGWQEIDKYFVLYAGTAGMLLLCSSMLLFFKAYHKRLMAQQDEKNKMELAYRDHLLYSNIQATENERARIARDLHDEVGASLSLLRMQITNDDAKNLIDTTIDNVRRLSYDLLPPSLEAFGLVAALQDYCYKIQVNANILVHLDAFDEHLRFDTTIELSVYRIFQELVNNSLKHSGATAITIGMYYNNGKMQLQYRDNGKGYTQPNKDNGLGLKNIELRIKQCSGTLQYQTKPDNTVEINIYIQTNANPVT